jgi:hypothetical protein
MKKYNLILAIVFVKCIAFGQIDTTLTLVSKIDAFPQFQLADVYDGIHSINRFTY